MQQTRQKGSDGVLTGNDILRTLRSHRDELVERFSVRRIGLFGSFLRGDDKDTSDVDILVEFDQPTFDHYMDLKFFLEGLFNRPVDLVIGDAVKPRIKPAIDRETAYA